MYQLKTKRSCFEIHPTGGGQWLSLSLQSPVDGKSVSVVSGHKAPDPFFASGSFLMFPWVNRLEPNPWAREPFYPSTHWLTDGNGIPLHGLFHNLPRQLVKEEISEKESYAEFAIEIPASWKGTLISKIHVKECYRLFPSELKVIYRLTNESDSEFPFALGIHPYFRWNEDESIDDLFLFGSGFYKVKLGDYLLPEKIQKEDILLNAEETLAGKNLDDLYFAIEGTNSYIGLFSMNKKEKLIIQGGEFYQVYTPQDRRSIAIEPMTGTGNFLHFPGGNPKTISPKTEKQIEFSIRLDHF
ncbi:aldose 1-epimerase [Leptospira soteropolitanensis]|uniref:Aldose 1-epimerase n=1 Tax=Leptospira soteropolitanensis TaxID=2950025 RepID=A0AAW5VNC8_9LEPT|nr:aldose 1-epimerase [Leptospira soteropolitanensis]MCW7493859.1 aldose 1-epimerase [Leptospira soteropolitanensis]MCW7501453.1 aldose 1-epimerase [Leptospira soteropolitanensis]MCW7523784.1 aldose 1-epimerase [Leptospira soteropolitanensis]MCW7531502.1 aldose 1-epimerase [Leptospira soteropolitanensis]